MSRRYVWGYNLSAQTLELRHAPNYVPQGYISMRVVTTVFGGPEFRFEASVPGQPARLLTESFQEAQFWVENEVRGGLGAQLNLEFNGLVDAISEAIPGKMRPSNMYDTLGLAPGERKSFEVEFKERTFLVIVARVRVPGAGQDSLAIAVCDSEEPHKAIALLRDPERVFRFLDSEEQGGDGG